MAILFICVGALMAIGTVLTMWKIHPLAGIPGAIGTIMVFGIASLFATVAALRKRVADLEGITEPPPKPRADTPGLAIAGRHSRAAAELLALAQEHAREHRAGNAKKLYRDVITQHVGTTQAAVAQRELAELDKATEQT